VPSPEPDVQIVWEGSWDVGDYFALPDDERLDTTMGVYQILTLEKDEVLYIGKTYHQTFGERVPQHATHGLAEWLDEEILEPVRLKIGHFDVRCQERTSAGLVDRVESLLIAAYGPPGNVSKQVTYGGGELTIENVGHRKPLTRWASAEDHGERGFLISNW
jgi:hypothetical protein